VAPEEGVGEGNDVFCRHDRTDGPLGAFVQNIYSALGDPNDQYTEVDTRTGRARTGRRRTSTLWEGRS